MGDPIRAPERVVFANAMQVLESLTGAEGASGAGAAGGAQSVGPVQIDLSGCSTFDSSLIAVLLELMRRAGAAGCAVSGASPNVVKLARLYGVDQVLFGSRSDA